MSIAINGRQGSALRTLCSIHSDGIILFDPGSQLDGVHGFAHILAVIGLQSDLIHHWQGVDLAEMQVGVGERFCDQLASASISRRPSS